MTRYVVEKFLVDQCPEHMDHVPFLVSTADPDTPNTSLNIVIGNGLRRVGHPPADLTLVTDEDIGEVPGGAESVFLAATLIALKKRVLNYYQSQQTQGVLSARHEFGDRANRLRAEINEEELALLSALRSSWRSVGTPIITATTIPHAPALPDLP